MQGLDKEQPFESSFQLHNKEPLTLRNIMQADLPRAELAFLSACHSASGSGTDAPDEILHLAAAMQFCGFRSVVGTLWQMRDRDGPEIAELFYGYMKQTSDVTFKNSAKALHDAVKQMTERREGEGAQDTRGQVPYRPKSAAMVYPWITFVHIGA